MWVLCNSLFSETTTTDPKARNTLPASHSRLNLSPIRKASFPPSGQVQGPQAARWLHSLRENQTAGRQNPFPPPRDLAFSPRRCASWPQPHCPADLSVPPVQGRRPGHASPRLAWLRPRARAQRLSPAGRAVSGLPGQTKRTGPAMPSRAEGGSSPGTPVGRQTTGEESGPGVGAASPANLRPAPHAKWSRPGRRREGAPTVLRRPFLGLWPGAQRRRAGGGLARVPPLLGPAHKEPRRGPAPAPRPGPQRERPRRRRTGPGPDLGGRAGRREASAPGRGGVGGGDGAGRRRTFHSS